jgi:MFS superfamily sulfate permease-like transporter
VALSLACAARPKTAGSVAPNRPTLVNDDVGPVVAHWRALDCDDPFASRGGRRPPNRTIVMLLPKSLFSGRDLKADLTAGFLVFLIALPLSLGIAMASGYPPIGGVMTALVGGLLTSFLGSARLTIKGPAAGLIVIAIGAVMELGGGDMALGYHRALAVGVVAGVVQIGFAVARLGFIGSLMPPAVVHGMLAAIGVIIISKQSHVLLGVVPESTHTLPLLAEIPSSLLSENPEVVLIGVVSLVILFGMPRLKIPALKRVPAPLVVLLVTVPLGMAYHFETAHSYQFVGHLYSVGPQQLVQLPANLLAAIAFPDFSVIGSSVSIKYIVMFTLVGSIESLLSATAVDSLDPAKRASNLDRDLLAVGIGNTIASAIGGLPMISEIVRSKANIDAGATSPFANFFHGLFLLVFVALLPGVLQRIPLAALAAMLVFTGTRLASPSEFKHAWRVGPDQLVVFVATFGVTLATDLLIGVGVGLVLEVGIHLARGARLRHLFGAEIEVVHAGVQREIFVHGCAAFTNLRALTRHLDGIDDTVRLVIVDFSRAQVVDHTVQERLHRIADEWPDCRLEIRGLDGHCAASGHSFAARWRRREVG